ncbi:unnamed protein product [Acanthoscelides obtectus]|uniref:Uncharacterized protein n=1 Tax=Acanthoscelides obtectus TaxID=200917 RepID=A0A9P0JPK7_ACAOB|nr:unnamed protein product [Acanthoscelides obtectus]CAK1641328.1 Dysferlin [Acanthoscelides obtectus]
MTNASKDNKSKFSLWSLFRPKFLLNKLQGSASEATTYEPLPQEDIIDTRDFDWWTKFYASIGEGPQMGDDEFVKQVQTLKVYDTELEKQSEFKGFTDKLTTFEMYKGKRTGDDSIDGENITGCFKGM